MLRERLVPVLFWVAASAVLPVAALHFLGREEVHLPSWVHFGAVGAGALAATGAALALT